MKNICMVYDVDARNLLEAHEIVAGASLEGSIDFVLPEPAYNVKNKRTIDNYLNEIFVPEDSSGFVQLVRRGMAEGAHGIVFCLSTQYAKWYRSWCR